MELSPIFSSGIIMVSLKWLKSDFIYFVYFVSLLIYSAIFFLEEVFEKCVSILYIKF